MNASPENAPTSEGLVDAFFSHLDALAVALDRAHLSRATPAELRMLVTLLDAVGDALDPVVAAVDATNAAD
jgi:hypothetical protein